MGSDTQGNDTYACSSSGCQISCASPAFGANVCYSMQQNFLDGTPCQGGGRCQNGQCTGSSVGKEIKSWVDDHKTLVIALASVLGGLLILGILSCCWSRYSRRQRLGRRPPPVVVPPPSGWAGNWMPPPEMAGGRGYQSPNNGYSNAANNYWQNGQGPWQQPQPPQQAWKPGPSVRYA
jgi:hypothetical protein